MRFIPGGTTYSSAAPPEYGLEEWLVMSDGGSSSNPGSLQTYGHSFTPTVNGRITGIRVYTTSFMPGGVDERIWSLWKFSDQSNLGTGVTSSFATNITDWQIESFAPILVDALTQYVMSWSSPAADARWRRYSGVASNSSNMTVGDGGYGRYVTGQNVFPTTVSSSSCYVIGPVFEPQTN